MNLCPPRFLIPVVISLAAVTIGHAQTTVTTDPVGFVTGTCLAASDTVVSVPFHQSPAYVGPLSSAPTNSGSNAILSFSAPGWSTNQYQFTHYVRFSSGAKAGSYYQVIANDGSTLTIALNGDTVAVSGSGDQIQLIPFWTLDTLFPPATQTTIVASAGTTPPLRKTQILFPDLAKDGINLSASAVYFLNGSTWTKAVTGFPTAGTTIIPPDCSFIIRHPASVATPTAFVPQGTVETGTLVSPLYTLASGFQDNAIAISRPVPLTLDEAGLASGFVASNGTAPPSRRDQILVFDNTATGLNKSASAVYFLSATVSGTNWVQATTGFPIVSGSKILQPGTGIIIRKYQASGGATAFWTNSPTY